jgi:alpha-galactosidase
MTGNGTSNPSINIVFIGAGSVEFTRQLLRDIFSFPELGGVRIALHDIDAERLSVAEALAHRTADRHGAKPQIVASTDRRTALEGAQVVVNMVAVGGHRATVTDFEVPARFGLRQTIGDTLGIGGIFRALRTFPLLEGLAADMAAVCPDAWLLNYTNPMAMNLQYLAGIAPGLKAAGLCHSVYWTVRDLCEIVGVPYEEVDVVSAGVNHQAWILGWEHRGRDLYPALDAAIDADPELRRRVRVDMYRRLGHYPTETSEHSSEYVPWYLHDAAEVERLRLPIRDYVGISAGNAEETEQLIAQVAAGEYVEPEEDAAEYAPQVIHSMVTGTPRRIQANVINRWLIDNLQQGAPVEVPCIVDGGEPAGTVRGAEPHLPLRGRPDRQGCHRGTARARPAGADARPQHRCEPAGRADLGPRRRDGRGARAPAARGAQGEAAGVSPGLSGPGAP